MSITRKCLLVKKNLEENDGMKSERGKNLKIKKGRETGSFPIVSNQEGTDPLRTKEEAPPKGVASSFVP